MIGKLKGKIDNIDDDSVIIDVGGVGYHVFCDARTLANLRETRDFAELIIETHVREDHIHLFGFSDVFEREWFRTLTSVQGVGVKMAIAILGIFSPAQIVNIIAAKDTKSLTKVSGIGAKIAERIVIELKNKALKLPVGINIVANGKVPLKPIANNTQEDAISALINLGYQRIDAYNAVNNAIAKIDEAEQSLDKLIKESLKSLMR
ncbi:MAG: Holliday junction branch migration protein RuvA [Pseudomonadota bacterium]